MKTILKLIVLFLATNVSAQWSYNPDQPNILSPGVNDEQGGFTITGQHSVADSAGNIISIYHNGVLSDFGIYAQKTDANGNLLWGNNGMLVYYSTYTNNDGIQLPTGSLDIQIVSDGSGGALISFLGNDPNSIYYPNPNDIVNYVNPFILFMIKIDANGNQVWAGRTYVSHPNVTNGSVQQHRLIADGSGGAYVAWSTSLFSYSGGNAVSVGAKIFEQHVNNDGSLQWTNDVLIKELDFHPQPSVGYNYYPVLNRLADGSVVIGWLDAIANDPNNSALFVNKVDVNGNLQWGSNGIIVESGYTAPIGSSPYAVDSYVSRIAVNDNGFFIAYLTTNTPNFDSLKLNFISNNGVLSMANSIVISTSYVNTLVIGGSNPTRRHLYDITTTATGDAIVLYSGYDNNSFFIPKIQKINQNGTFLWSSNGIAISENTCSTPTEALSHLKIVKTSDGKYIATWNHLTTIPGFAYSKMKTQKIDDNGQLLFEPKGVTFSNKLPLNINLLPDNIGGAVAIFSTGSENFVFASKIIDAGNFAKISLANEGINTNMNTIDGINYSLNNISLNATTTYFNRDTNFIYYNFYDFPTGIASCSSYESTYAIPIGTYNVTFNLLTGVYSFTTTLGVQQQLSSSIKLFPNPTTSLITLQIPNNVSIDKIMVTDITGKIILQQTQNTTQVNVEKLSSGMYILETFSGSEKFICKFIKE